MRKRTCHQPDRPLRAWPVVPQWRRTATATRLASQTPVATTARSSATREPLAELTSYCRGDRRLDARLRRHRRLRRLSRRAAGHRRRHDAGAGAGGDVHRAAARPRPHGAPRAGHRHGVDHVHLQRQRAHAPPPGRRRLVAGAPHGAGAWWSAPCWPPRCRAGCRSARSRWPSR